MPHFNPSQTTTNTSPSGSQTSRSALRNLELAAYARPNQEVMYSLNAWPILLKLLFFDHVQESLYQLLTVPFNPDPCLYPPPTSMADRNHNYTSFLPVAPPSSHPVSTSPIPRSCFEEFITHPLRSARPDLVKWGGPVDFGPVKLPDKQNKNVFGTPLRDILAGFGLRDPEVRLFQSLAAAGKSHIDFKIMVS
jgi:hypothetical protein